MKVRVYYNDLGNIASVMEVDTSDEKKPPVQMHTIPPSKDFEIELSGDLAKLSLLEIHTKYKVNTSENPPRLVKIEANHAASDRTSSG